MNTENETFYLFTYGTLMKGERNEHLLREARFVGKAMTKPKYKLFRIDGNFTFPAIIDEGSVAVVGEVYEVPMAALPGMDRMEGHPNFYCRKPIELDVSMVEDTDRFSVDELLRLASAPEVIAYFFVKKEQLTERYPEIKSGNWLKR